MKHEINYAFNGIKNLLYKSYIPAILNASLEIGVFESLAIKEKGVDELASELKTVKNITEALLPVLEAIELLECKEGRYGLTGLARQYLLQTAYASQVMTIRSFKENSGPFAQLENILKEGPPIPFNKKIWSNEQIIIGMEQQAKAGMIQNIVSFIKEIPEFKKCRKMCDLAGSSGYSAFALMEENKELEAHVYDFEEVCEIARRVKKNESSFNRINYHSLDLDSEYSFESNIDLFLCSHFLYEYGVTNKLVDFLKRVNKHMPLGGIFVSNHISRNVQGDDFVVLNIIELMTRCMGYPTHILSEERLTNSLSQAGFGQFRIRISCKNTDIPTLLVSASKIKNI